MVRLGKPRQRATYAPFSIRQIVELILLLPLNFIPWVGVPLFLWLTGYRAGPLQHWRYFALRQFTKAERDEFIKQHRLQYTGFGTSHLVLELIPPFSMLFLLTTAAGSALLAARFYELEQSHGAEESPPAYTDEVDPNAA